MSSGRALLEPQRALSDDTSLCGLRPFLQQFLVQRSAVIQQDVLMFACSRTLNNPVEALEGNPHPTCGSLRTRFIVSLWGTFGPGLRSSIIASFLIKYFLVAVTKIRCNHMLVLASTKTARTICFFVGYSRIGCIMLQ